MTKELIPVILRLGGVHAQVLFEALDSPFGLTISLLMVGGGHVKASAKTLEEACPEDACEAGVSVGDNRLGKTIASENVLEEYHG